MDYNESVMHKKISNLQLKLLDYGEKDKRSLESNQPVQVHKMRKEKRPTSYLKKLLLSICVVGPFLVPVFLYHTEGYRSLFWPATGFSTLASVLLLLYLSSRIPAMVAGFNKIFCGARSKVKIVVQDTEYFSNRRRIQCTLLVGVILLILGVGRWAGGDNQVLFNLSLVAVGYIAGILSVNLYGFFMQSKRLPYYSPLHKKRDGPSPAKRELDFSNAALTSSPCLNPMDCFRPSPERDMRCSELIHRGPLPVPPMPPPLTHSPSKQKRSYSPFN